MAIVRGEIMDKEALKKLAEWAGFTWWQPLRGFLTPEHIPELLEPSELDFTDPVWGISYCFKWLVPKLREERYHYKLNSVREGGHFAVVWRHTEGLIYNAQAETPALALCLAISKLIDGEANESLLHSG